MALAVVLVCGTARVSTGGPPLTHYWQSDLDALNIEPVQHDSPRPRHAPDRALREADSLYRLALNAAPQRDTKGRYTWQFDRRDTVRDTVLVLFRDRAATEFAREVSPLVEDSPQSVKAQKAWTARMRNRTHFLDGRQHKLEVRYKANVFDRFQYAAAMVVDIPRNMLAQLSKRTDVASIQTLVGGTTAGPCGAPDETPLVAGQAMGLDRFRAAGFGHGRVALLDTGAGSTHPVLVERVDRWINCDDPMSRCIETAGQEDADAQGHGTASAAILVGRDQGITDARLTSYKIYKKMGSKYGLFRDGAGWAMEDAIRSGYDVIVAELADTGDAKNLVGRLASEAFDLGTIVVAAGGNDSLLPLPSPATSPRALGIGAYCVHDGTPILSHSRGRTADGRVKPEIGGPTSVYTAGSDPNQISSRPFGGTSGATPFAAAAALYLKNWMSAGGRGTVSPGAVYAMLLACGAGSSVDSRTGAGLVMLPSGGTAWWGKAIIGSRQAIEIPLTSSHGSAGVEAALWWPEYGRNGAPPERRERANLALQVLSRDGRLITSADPGSVFQRVSLPSEDASSTGPWKLIIAGTSLPRGAREVYWAAWAKPASQPIP